ncbi:MAG: SUMF1/EgtB/PvdO family nonheme iron enzyme [Alphaproteobacteria bacterium]|nr:SUMF1/EgtB/PvdO family nonheme iron enzyme [Alphaproteobacteria bacterium]
MDLNNFIENFIFVKGGVFSMGSDLTLFNNDELDNDFETPSQIVHIDDFYISKYCVTQSVWVSVMNHNPSCFKNQPNNESFPVEQVSWKDCQLFLSKLNNLKHINLRLPTEAEWEFAAKGGHESLGYKYAGSNEIKEVAWYHQNSKCTTHPIGLKIPNELGLFDMSGNVWEWCADWFDVYNPDAKINPSGPIKGADKVLKGGSWLGNDKECRITNRNFDKPTGKRSNTGFRIAFSV